MGKRFRNIDDQCPLVQHCRITALGNDPAGGGIRLEPMFFKILLPRHALNSILPIQDQGCSTVGIEHGRRGSQLLELTSSFLATLAVARTGQNRWADCLEFHLTALARREEMSVSFSIHSFVSLLSAFIRRFSVASEKR